MTALWALLWACGGDDEVDGGPTTTPAPTADTSVAPTTPAEPNLERLRAELDAAGFEIREGRPGFLPLEACCDWVSCFKWNPTSAYGLWYLPLGPGESAVGRELDADGMQWHWRLRPDEAVLMVGDTPPSARYHSYRTYVHETAGPTPGVRVPSFLNLGDSLNQVVLQTDGGPWTAGVAVLTVADADIADLVRGALDRSGYDADRLNIDRLPADLIRFGLSDDADTVRMMHRVALIDDPVAQAEWLAAPPETVWRLSPRTPKAPLVPIPAVPYRAPGTGRSEAALQPAVEELAAAIRAAYPALASVESPVNVREVAVDEDCWRGCNRDAGESNIAAVRFPEGSEHFMVAFGVNHHRSGFAAYHNVIMFGAGNDDPAAVLEDPEMVGSARAFLPDHPQADELYAWLFSRDCAGRPYCTELSTECPGVELDEDAALHFRAYLDPTTGTHPSKAELVSDRVLVFKPPAAP